MPAALSRSPRPSGGPALAGLIEVEPAGTDTWRGPAYPGPGRPDIFGGQVAGQALRAATLTVDGGHLPNSVHCYFLRRGRSAAPVEIGVTRVRDGRTYASRQVEVRQDGRVIFSMMASFHTPEPGRERVHPMAAGVAGPDELAPESPSMWDPLVEVRPLPGPGPAIRWWGRVPGPFPPDVMLHHCGLLYASDLRAGSAALVAAGFGDGMSPLLGADGRPVGNFGSLDHALWYHRTPVVDDWFFCEVRPSTVRDSRGLVQGRMFDREGHHLATFAQEMFLKEHDASPFAADRPGEERSR